MPTFGSISQCGYRISSFLKKATGHSFSGSSMMAIWLCRVWRNACTLTRKSLKFTVADTVKNSLGILFRNEKCNYQSFSLFRQISLGSQIRSSSFTQWARILSKGRVSSCTHLPVGIPADIHSCGLGYPLPSDALGVLPQLFLHGSLTGNSVRPVNFLQPLLCWASPGSGTAWGGCWLSPWLCWSLTRCSFPLSSFSKGN